MFSLNIFLFDKRVQIIHVCKCGRDGFPTFDISPAALLGRFLPVTGPAISALTHSRSFFRDCVMFSCECTYQPTAYGIIFLPPDCETDYQCELYVEFEPLDFSPAEPDVGAGPDFDWQIASIGMLDARDRYQHTPSRNKDNIRILKNEAFDAAKRFLEAHHARELHDQANAETAEAFDAPYWRAA